MNITIEISPGELIDRLTILVIKSEEIKDCNKLINIQRELRDNWDKYCEIDYDHIIVDKFYEKLCLINRNIWKLEEEVRSPLLDWDELGAVAEKIVIANDERAATKKEINVLLGSSLVEEKSHKNL